MSSSARLEDDPRIATAVRPARPIEPPIAILLIGIAASLPFLVLRLVDPARATDWNVVHWCLSAAAATAASVWSIRGATGRARLVRVSASLILGLWLLANIAWVWAPEIQPTSFLGFGDLFVVAIIAPGVVILATAIRGRLTAAAAAAVYLDSAIGFITIATGLVLFLGPLVATLSLHAAVLALVYPTVFIGMAGAGMIGLLAVGYPIAARGSFPILLGGGIVGIAFVGWIMPTATRTPAPALADLLFTVGTFVTAYGTVTWRDELSANPAYLRLARTTSRIVGPAVAGFLFLALVAPVPDEVLPAVRAAVFAGGILFVARQALLLRERSAMLDEVRALHAENDGLVADLRHELEERARVQAGLIETSRAAAVGQLASGVAHQVNNPLSGVLGYAELLLADLPPGDPRRADLQVIRDEALRARTIMWALRDFARPAEQQVHPTDLNALVERTVDLIRYPTSRGGVMIELTTGEVPDQELDPQAIQQAILNVLTNAIQASSPGDRVIVETGLRDGRIAVRIIDQGVGMDEGTVARAFEPFFAARAEPGSIGLGLSIAREIVDRHGGSIEIESAPDVGTTVEIRLPPTVPGTAAVAAGRRGAG